MKKLLLVILSLIIFTPLHVKADIGAPQLQSYEAIVVKEEGSIFYTYDYDHTNDEEAFIEVGVLPKGSTITIVNEEYRDNTWWGYGWVDDYDDYCYIKLNELMLANATFDLNKATHLDEKYELIVINEGVKLYNGPSKMYKEVSGEIPIGTILTYEYTDGSGFESLSDLWVYTNYNGQQGWVYIYPYDHYGEASGVARVDNTTIYTLDNISILYDYPNENAKTINVNIPKNEELNVSYRYGTTNRNYSSWVYINTSDIQGWINLEDGSATDQIKEQYITTQEIMLYTEFNNEASQADIPLPANTEITFKYERDNWALINYNNVNYWLKLINGKDYTYLNLANTTYIKSGIVMKDNAPVYETPNNTSTIIATKNTGEEIKLKYEDYKDGTTWYYIENLGWINKNDIGTSSSSYYKVISSFLRVYKSPNISEVTGILDHNEEFTTKYNYRFNNETWYYLEKGNIKGWVKYDRSTLEYIEELSEIPSEEETNEVPTEQELPTINKDEPKEENLLTTKQTIIISVIVAICLSLSALVAIILINKKKKVKINENDYEK